MTGLQSISPQFRSAVGTLFELNAIRTRPQHVIMVMTLTNKAPWVIERNIDSSLTLSKVAYAREHRGFIRPADSRPRTIAIDLEVPGARRRIARGNAK
jgi:hypothetical protein